ncbi:tenascin-X isoform X12 [Lacerta agilis]|uniref:tenascin-X isoform X12 n=1 Tax=Lacerta agilis TaxID=80427 RepID=UPI00141963F8|nr:tenascin-X isoform X12 [Lacerta agilis]
MGRQPRPMPFLLFLFWLGTSWEAHVPHRVIPSNATVFSHIYTIKLKGDGTEDEGASSAPQEALGPPGSSRGGGLYEHTLEGPDQEHVVFTHRINLPQQSCGCPPGTEDTQDLLRRLQALENEVRSLRDTCQAGGGCCPATSSSQASTGQTDTRTLCSNHGSFDLSRCLCECEAGWSGPTCAEPTCPGGCGGAQRGKCTNGRCQCRPGYSGARCEEPPSCPDDCNDQGRCVDGRCTCFPGYVGPSCADPACPQDCQGHGRCVDGQCVCDPGYSGPDCGSRACPSNCNRRGECHNGRCLCEPGFTGPACGTKACPNDCSQRGRCLKGAVCACHKGYTGPDCGQLACPEDCSGRGECQNGVCLCHDGYSGEDCSIEIPSIGIHVKNRDETSFRLEWNRPEVSVDAYEIHVKPTRDQQAGESVRLSGTETGFERRGLMPGEEYTVTVRAEKGQRYGPPVTQTVRTRVAPPRGLQSSQVTENSMTLDWEPPASRPDGYILSYVPLVASRPAQAVKRVELPAAPERVTLDELESSTRYRITMFARQSGENSRATSIIVSTTAPAPSQPVRQYSTPPPSSSHRRPDSSSSGPAAEQPGNRPQPGRSPSNVAKAKELFMKKMTENISTKLSPYNGTLLERLESYLRAINFPLHGNRTIQSVARDIYIYLILRKPEEVIESFKDRLDRETDDLLQKTESPTVRGSYSHSDHPKPAVVGSSSGSIEVSLDSVRGVSDNVVILYRNTGTGEVRELVVPGDSSRAVITGLDPGTTYHVEIHGVLKGRSSKSYSFITATAPGSPSAAKTQTFPRLTTQSPEVPLRDLTVTDVSPDSLRVTWLAPPSSFRSFSLQYRDPKSSAPPGEIRVPGTERSVTVMGLTPRTEYELELSGEKLDGSYSPPLTTKTFTAPAPAVEKPTLGHISVSDVKENSARLSWDVPTGTFDSFLIQYKDAEGKPKSLPVDGGSREVTIYDLAPSRKYKFSLYGLIGRKRHGPVSTEMVTGKVPAPEKKPEREVTAPPGLGELSTSDITSSSVRLSWSVPSGRFDSFLVQYKDAEGRPQVLPMEGDSREVTIPSLAPSRKYRFNLYGISGRKRLGPATADVTTASRDEEPVPEPEPEPVLGDFSISDATSNSVRLTWNVPTGSFDSFFLQYKDSEGIDQALTIDRNSREATVPNLVPSQRYTFFLYGISGPQRLGPVSVDATTAPLPTTPAPQPSLGELSVSDVTTDSVRLSWTVPTGSFDSFLVQYKDAEGKPQALPVDGGSREVTVSSLVPSRRYKFNLYGLSGRKRLGPVSTDTVTASLPKEPSIAPSLGELSASDATSSSVRLSWTVPTGNFDSFLIQYKDAEGKPQAIPVEGVFRETIVPNLVPSRRYKFNLYGLTGRKRLGPISTDATTDQLMVKPTPPLKLGELTAGNPMPNSLDLSWTVEAGDFDSFIIQYQDAQGKPQVLPVDGRLRSLHLHDLAPSHRYQINLYGVLGRKRLGPISTEAETAPLPTTPAPQPSLGELSVSDVTTDSVRLSWTVPTGSFDSFLVQYKDAEGKPQALPVDGGSREVTVSSLVPSRRYKFNLYGLSGRKRLGPVSTDTVTAVLPTTPAPQPSLGELSALDITTDSIRLSWTVPTGNFDSFLIQYKDAEGKPQAIPVEGVFRETTVPNLVPSRRYKFNLYGLTGRKRHGPISTDATTVAELLAAPTLGELSVSDVTSESARLSWTVLAGRFDSFLVQYKDAEGKPQQLPLDGATYETTISGLSPARRYKFNLYGIVGRKRLGPVSADTVTAAAVSGEGPAKPSLEELSVSEVTSNSALLSWTVPTGDFDSFLIQYKDAEGKPQALTVEGVAREVTVSNLVPFHRYKFNLYGVVGRRRLGPISSEATTAEAEEDNKEGEEDEDDGESEPSLGQLSVSEANSNSIRLSWSVPTGNFDSFLVQYEDGEDELQTLPVDGASREVTVSNLSPSQRYRFDLYGLSGGERLGHVSIDASTAPLTPVTERGERGTPPPGSDFGQLSASDVTSDSVRLSWDVPSGIFDSFLIQYKDADNKPQALPVDKETNSVVIYYLVPSYRYKFNLFGLSGRRRFGPISVIVVTATQLKRDEVDAEDSTGREPRLGQLSVSEVTSNAARLSWSVPKGSFDSFSVQYRDAEGKPQALPVGGGSREVIVSNLVPSHKYNFNLYGISGNQRFGPISATAEMTATDPDVQAVEGKVEPRLGQLSVSEVTSNTARLSWSVPEGSFDSFSVQYKDADGRPQALPVGGGSREVIVSNLVPFHKYRFNLYGIYGNQRFGPNSANAVTAAPETTPPGEEKRPEEAAGQRVQPSLGDATVSEVTPDSLLLSWNIQEGSFDSFLIQYKDAAGKLQVLPVDGTMRSLHLYNLVPSQRYKFNIFGVSGSKRLGPVSTDAVTAPEPATSEETQPRLGDLSVSKTTSDSVSLSWSVPAGNFDSFLVQYKDREGKPQVLPLNGDSRNVTVPNLAPSHRYKFNLYGIYGHKRLGPISTDAVTGTQPGALTQLKFGELSARDITPESVLLSWTVETGNFDSFIIQYRDADGNPHALPVDGGLRSLRLHDLVPSHKYRFNLYGVSGRKRLGPISTEATTAVSEQPAPPKPTLGELSASDITSTTVRLSWSVRSGDFDSFIIQYRDAEGKAQALPVDRDSRDVIVSGLVPSRKYKFNLFGISGRKRLGPISTEAATAPIVKTEVQPTLGDLSISEVTQDSVRLSWTISAGKFDSFLIQYKDADGKLQAVPVDADSRTVVIKDLTTSHRYKFNLYGISGRKWHGPISIDAVTAFPEANERAFLENLVVSEVTPTTLQLTWEVPKGEFDFFLVQRKNSVPDSEMGPTPTKKINVTGDDRSVMFRGLSPNTEYSLTVYGIQDGSEAASINTVATTSGTELDSPRDLLFSDIHETSVVANWRSPSSRVDGYKVSFQPSDGGEPRSISVDGSKLRTTIEGLTPGASYEVTVMSVRGFEESEPLVGYVTTVPDGPSNLRAIDVTDSSAVLTWQPAVAQMNNYIVTYGPAGGARASESVPGNRAELQLSGLHLDTEYRASVYGEKGGNRSSPASATFTTGPDGPRDLQASEISPRSARLTWLPPRAPPGGYLLTYETPSGRSKEITVDASVTSYELQDLIPSSLYQVQVQALRRGTPTAPTATSFTTGHLRYPFPRDCAEESQNGPGTSRVRTIYLGGNQDRPLQVYCDMETDGGGWIVFQRRMNGETNFWRNWQEYATGFGNLTREFWLGNDALHQLTTSGDYELRVDLRAGNESVYATYQNFRVDPPADHYRLHLGSYSGTAGDAFTYHSGSVFSTKDRDPNRVIIPCAVSYRGAWWYRNCHYANLNGLYANNRDHQGINWFNWKGFEFSIPFTEMKMRPRGFRPLRRV